MLLPLNMPFEGFTPLELLPQSTHYREVYNALVLDTIEVTLVLYNMNKLPEYYKDGKIPELELANRLKSPVFPSFWGEGEYEDEYISIKWYARKKIMGKPLTQCINERMDFTLDSEKTLQNFLEIVDGIHEISMYTNYGGHNNINTDNIIVSEDSLDNQRWYLTGMSCISAPCNGKATFDESVQKMTFRAPETALGRYNQATDVFSLGMVLSYLYQSKSPWYKFTGEDILTYVKYIRENNPVIDIDINNKYYNLVRKSIATRISERYQNLIELSKAASRILDYTYTENTSNKETTNIPVYGQPSTTATFKRETGNGFRDVAGMGELKGILTQNFVDIMKHKEMAGIFGIRPANALILHGPPGVGKTFIAGKLAEESGLQTALIRPSDLANIYLHGSQSMIADLFNKSEEMAKKNNRGVLLIFDEFDSLVPKRGTDSDSNHQANEVAEFLTRLNNCAEKGIYVVATTNRIDAIDPAILRAGRTDLIIYVGLPDSQARKEIFALELSKRPHKEIDLDLMALLTEGYTSSDISFIVKECAKDAFQKSIMNNQIIEITQELMETTIRNSRSSVSEKDMKYYEETRSLYSKDKQQHKPRIGFKK